MQTDEDAFQIVRVTKEIFLPDADLKRLLKLGPNQHIVEVKRSSGMTRRGDALNLHGCIVTVVET